VLDKLAVERRDCEARVNAVAARLQRESAVWVPRGGEDRRPQDLHRVADAFLSACILPRMMLSSADAVFCFEFAKRLQALEARGWSAILFYVGRPGAWGGAAARGERGRTRGAGQLHVRIPGPAAAWEPAGRPVGARL
jgi:hypothetical protein